MKKLVITEFVILLIGTLFAWANFSYELYNYLNKQECTLGCAKGLVNPFLTPCFYGACFFLTAFIISAVMLKKTK
ncbi:MAG: hypothetical protein WCX95_00895 [Candidatus Gracilibacteria bacterium]